MDSYLLDLCHQFISELLFYHGRSVGFLIDCACSLELEKAMAPVFQHSSTLAWKIPWTEEPG